MEGRRLLGALSGDALTGGWGVGAALTAGAHWRRLFFTRAFTFECFTIQYHVQMRRESS